MRNLKAWPDIEKQYPKSYKLLALERPHLLEISLNEDSVQEELNRWFYDQGCRFQQKTQTRQSKKVVIRYKYKVKLGDNSVLCIGWLNETEAMVVANQSAFTLLESHIS